MGQNFEFVGRLSMPKETEKFKPFEELSFKTGSGDNWLIKKLKANIVCGTNRHMLSFEDGCFEDGHNDIYLFSKQGVDDNGNKVKGEMFKIKFSERLTSKRLPEVAEFKKFVFDLEEKGRRFKLKKAVEDLKEGKEITEELLKELKVDSVDKLNEELEISNKKRKEFVTMWDLIDVVNKVLKSGKYDNKKFKVVGEQITEYNDFNDKYYTKYVPQKIYLMPDDEEEVSKGVVELYYTGNAIDDSMVEENGKYYINGFGLEYNRKFKKNVGYPITIVMPKKDDEKTEKRLKVYKKYFTTEEGTYNKICIEVEFLDGAQKVEITDDLLMEMLTEDQLDLLMLEEVTLADLRKEMGFESAYGDRVNEILFVKLAKGYSKGGEETAYTDETFAKPVVEDNSVDTDSFETIDSDDLDLDDLDLDEL